MIIGICGKSGSGKSTLTKKIVNILPNTVSLDIDYISHYVLKIEECKKKITSTFGDVLTNDEIDRKKLGDIVFKNNEEMNKLTLCTWEYMEKEIDKFIENNKDKNIILEWILLPKTKYYGMCNFKILIDIPYDIRMRRTILRDSITEEKFKLRDSASINYNKEDFDYIINDINFNDVERIIELL